MKLHLSQFSGQNAFTGYGPDFVLVNQQRYERSLIVMADRLLDSWQPRSVDALTAADFELLASLGVDIVLLGTGPSLRFPAPALVRLLPERGIGLEVMDSFAAARTYNILLAEGRRVAAALLL